MSTVISAVLFSVSKEVAEGGIYGQLRSLIDSTPYFQEMFPRDKNLKYDVVWSEKRMRIGYGSNANDQIGQNMYLGILDEGNFFQGEANSSMQSAKTMSKSQSLYLTMRRRGENRFSQGGVDYSLSVLISSARTSNSMVERRIEATRGNPHVYVIHAVSYEITPQKYSAEKFTVFLGNDMLDPMIVTNIGDIRNICDSLQVQWPESEDVEVAITQLEERIQELFTKVPVNLKKSYEDDIISALQDLSGISVSPMGRLFTSRKHYNECIDPDLKHPFIQDSFVISTGNQTQVSDFLRSDWVPAHPEKARYLHIDQSITTDSTGMACVYVDSIQKGPTGEILPHITVDFVLQINPPTKPNEIDIAKCRAFVLYLKNHFKLKIGKCTYDQHQCLAPDTYVYTTEGYRHIIDVDEGDYIYTQNGFRRVNQKRVYKSVDCKRVGFNNGTSLTMSNNHRMSKFIGYKNNKPQFEWEYADKLNIGDKIQKVDTEFTGLNVLLDRTYRVKNTDIDIITPDLAYLIGYYLGDGYMKFSYKKDRTKYFYGVEYVCGSFNEATNILEHFQNLRNNRCESP